MVSVLVVVAIGYTLIIGTLCSALLLFGFWLTLRDRPKK